MGISEATSYYWKKKYGGLGVPELRRFKQSVHNYNHLRPHRSCGYLTLAASHTSTEPLRKY